MLTLGVTTCLAASILFFPALLAWLTRNRPAEEEAAIPGRASESLAPDVSSTEEDEPPAQPVSGQEISVDVLDDAERASETLVLRNLPAEPPPLTTIPLLAPPEAPAVTVPLPPAPVTDEEIAALLESALYTRPLVAPIADETNELDSDAAVPRRRNLPRRSEAA